MSLVIDIAEGIKELLAEAPGGTFSADFAPERKYLPRLDPAEAPNKLSVQIVPRADDRALATRGGHVARDIPIDVGIQKKLTTGLNPETEAANPELDGLMTLAEEVADYLEPGKRLGGAVILRTLVEPIYIPEHLAQHSVFTSVITVTVKVA